MAQRSLHWNGASIGDANALVVTATDGIGYRLANSQYESPFVDRMCRAIFNGTGNRGVLDGWLNELAVTGVATPIQVATGGAILYGLFYENTAAVNVAIASPTTDTRVDRVVIRRNWAAQTARITVITGVEGASAPAITQSPAPVGVGIYDIPLARISVTTGGVITVTDEREFCTFPTGFSSLASGQLANNSVNWGDREIRWKRLFLGAGDLEPNTNAGSFTYSATMGRWLWEMADWTQVGPPTWGGVANEQGWRTTGAATTYRGVYGTFRIPADWAGGSIYSYVWWVNNVAVAASFSIGTSFQVYPAYSTTTDSALLQGTDVEVISSSGAVSDVYRTPTIIISGPFLHLGFTAPPTWPPLANVPYPNIEVLSGGELVHYYAAFYNSAGTEDISILGVEFIYAGYT